MAGTADVPQGGMMLYVVFPMPSMLIVKLSIKFNRISVYNKSVPEVCGGGEISVYVSSMSRPRVGDDLPASQSACLPGGSCQSSGAPHGNVTYITPL